MEAMCHMFDLEKMERRLLIFLLAALLLGAGVVAYKKSFPSGSLRLEPGAVASGTQARAIPRADKKININTASIDELMDLKGVGKVLAGRITEYRAANGLFVSKEDLKKVQGIGDKLFISIKDDICLE